VTARECVRFLNGNPPSTAATAFLAILPILLGLVLGVTAIGGEIENGTAAFAWSIAAGRRRWLFERIVLGTIATAVFALACGLVSGVIVAKLPGSSMPVVELRESAVLGLVTLVFACAAAIAVANRRP
jgi:ABC-type transport system involved in multi-copper enzyme maturation permease subunit